MGKLQNSFEIQRCNKTRATGAIMAGARPSKRSRLTDDDSDDDDEDTFVFQYSEEGQCTPTASTTHCMWQCVSALEELKHCRNAVNGQAASLAHSSVAKRVLQLAAIGHFLPSALHGTMMPVCRVGWGLLRQIHGVCCGWNEW